MDWNTILIGILGGTLPVIAKAIFDSQKNKSEAAEVVVDSSIKLMEKLEERIETLEKELARLKKREAAYARNQKKLLKAIDQFNEVLKDNDIKHNIVVKMEALP